MNQQALVLALSIAASAHVLLYALLGLWPAPTLENEKRSIPVTLIRSADSQQSTASTNASSAAQASSNERIASKAFSKQKTPDSEKKKASESKSQRDRRAQRASSKSESNNLRSRNQVASIEQLFTSTSDDAEPLKVVPTDNPAMSPYEMALLKHLLEGELYDQFHRYMESARANEIDFRVRLRLFENGAIRSAAVVSKSVALPIEPLAVTAAYNASPYPRPPSDDYQIEYTYFVNMSYSEEGFVQAP